MKRLILNTGGRWLGKISLVINPETTHFPWGILLHENLKNLMQDSLSVISHNFTRHWD